MNIEDLRDFCLSIEGAIECTPFDDVTLVFKIYEKMFAVIPLDSERLSISLKCDPEKAIELREHYNCVEAAWHFNKKYWNTIYPNGDMKDDDIQFWIEHSVSEVVKKVPKKLKQK